jgi:hypothetical protein
VATKLARHPSSSAGDIRAVGRLADERRSGIVEAVVHAKGLVTALVVRPDHAAPMTARREGFVQLGW